MNKIFFFLASTLILVLSILGCSSELSKNTKWSGDGSYKYSILLSDGTKYSDEKNTVSSVDFTLNSNGKDAACIVISTTSATKYIPSTSTTTTKDTAKYEGTYKVDDMTNVIEFIMKNIETNGTAISTEYQTEMKFKGKIDFTNNKLTIDNLSVSAYPYNVTYTFKFSDVSFSLKKQ